MAASRKFYQDVFGWELTQWSGGQMEYWLIKTGEPGAPGIEGALGGAANGIEGTANTVEAPGLDESPRKAQAIGGRVIVAKDQVPGVGYLASVREPDLASLHPPTRRPCGPVTRRPEDYTPTRGIISAWACNLHNSM